MEKLPPELRHLIVSQLAAAGLSPETTRRIAGQAYTVSKLARYSTISKHWQSLIESYTFQHVSFSSHDLIAGKAKRVLSPCRLHLIRTITVSIDLEPEDIEAAGGFLDDEASIFGSRVFTATIASLFELLEPLPGCGLGSNIAIRLEVLSPYHIDPVWGRGGRNEREAPMMEEARVRDGHRKVTYLGLVPGLESQLCSLPSVSALEIAMNSHTRLLEPGSICRIAACMGHLSTLEMRFGNMGKENDELRMRLREDLSQGLFMIPASVRHLKLEYSADEPTRGWKSDNSILHIEEGSGDGLSGALFAFSRRPGLASFEVKARVDSTIFGPDCLETSDSAWKELKEYDLTLPGTLPSGASLFGEVPSPFDSHKLILSDLGLGAAVAEDGVLYDDPQEGPMNHTAMKDFWMASGRAAARMPFLQHLSISVAARGRGRDWSLAYDPEDGLEVVAPPPYSHPSETCLRPWRQLADRHGKEMRMTLKGPTSKFADHVIN